MRRCASIGLLLFAVLGSRAVAQTPMEFRPLTPPSALDSSLRRAIVEKAGSYPFVGFQTFGRDSALLVFEDSTLSLAGLRDDTWMFGPPVAEAERDSCPPQKVLGRKLARIFWRGLGRPSEVKYIIVSVRGTKGVDRWTSEAMFYPRSELERPWVGDPQR